METRYSIMASVVYCNLVELGNMDCGSSIVVVGSKSDALDQQDAILSRAVCGCIRGYQFKTTVGSRWNHCRQQCMSNIGRVMDQNVMLSVD